MPSKLDGHEDYVEAALACGDPCAEIAGRLDVSPSTVDRFVKKHGFKRRAHTVTPPAPGEKPSEEELPGTLAKGRSGMRSGFRMPSRLR